MNINNSIILPGNGKSVIEVDIALNVIMIGDADHFIQTFDIKYADNNNTSKKVITKNPLQK